MRRLSPRPERSFTWSVSFVWLNETNLMNNTNQMNQIHPTRPERHFTINRGLYGYQNAPLVRRAD